LRTKAGGLRSRAAAPRVVGPPEVSLLRPCHPLRFPCTCHSTQKGRPVSELSLATAAPHRSHPALAAIIQADRGPVGLPPGSGGLNGPVAVAGSLCVITSPARCKAYLKYRLCRLPPVAQQLTMPTCQPSSRLCDAAVTGWRRNKAGELVKTPHQSQGQNLLKNTRATASESGNKQRVRVHRCQPKAGTKRHPTSGASRTYCGCTLDPSRHRHSRRAARQSLKFMSAPQSRAISGSVNQ
jgi:hypothetical protein